MFEQSELLEEGFSIFFFCVCLCFWNSDNHKIAAGIGEANNKISALEDVDNQKWLS